MVFLLFLKAHRSGVKDIHNTVRPSPLTHVRTCSSCQAETLYLLDGICPFTAPHPRPRLACFTSLVGGPADICPFVLAYFAWCKVFRVHHVEVCVRTSLLWKAGYCPVVCAASCLPVRLLTGTWLVSTLACCEDCCSGDGHANICVHLCFQFCWIRIWEWNCWVTWPFYGWLFPCVPQGLHHRPLPSVEGDGPDSSVSSPALVVVRALPAFLIVH